MKTHRPYLIFVLLFFCCSASFAQYGSGVDGNINDGAGVTFTDGISTHLTANAGSGQPVITVNDASSFANGDLCLVIQMLGTGVGRYEEATISSKTATTITFTGNLIYAYSANGTTNLAQVIRIPQYNNVTLKTPGDVLTCSGWNGLTGGVCYFKVNGTLDTDADGTVTVAGKGYRGGSGTTLVISNRFDRPGRGAIANAQPPALNASKHGGNANDGCAVVTTGGGFGSSGGVGANGNGGQGGNLIPSSEFSVAVTYFNSRGDGDNGASGNSGEGPGAGTATSAATNNSNSNNWGATSGYDLLMGGGGAQGKQGFSGGRPSAGGGAGFGIAQRDGFCAVTGAPDGVAGGNGGAGGGILAMSVNTILGSGNISVAGGNGLDGATGTTGSTGGNGGSTSGGASIGGGGGGRGGTGGGGSCPGHGGAAGSLRIGYLFPGYTFATGGGAIGAYGAGGLGGTGGGGGNGSSIGNDGPDDGQGGPGGYGGWSADGCIGAIGSPTVSTNPGKQTGQAGGAGGVPGCNDDSYCTSFAGGSGVVVLPIQLLSFTGIQKNEVNVLRWVTLTETNNDYFTLYRSEDAESWHEISKINGAGTSSMQHYYEYTDENPEDNKVNYYQLQQTDFDGKSTRSNIIAIAPKGKSSIFIAENEIKVIIPSASTIHYQIIDIAGHIVARSQPEKFQQGLLSIDISGLAASVYLLRITVGQRAENIKFIKK